MRSLCAAYHTAVFSGRVRSLAVTCGRVRSCAVVRDRVWSCAISCGREQILPMLRYNLLSPGIISNRSQNARSMAHSLLTHSVSLSVVQFVVVGRSRQIKLSGRSALTVACNRPFFAHTSGFRAFDTAQKIREVNIISRICSAPKTAEFRLGSPQ